MSHLGQNATSRRVNRMSALPPKADIGRQLEVYKLIGKRPNPQWRSLDDRTADERPLESLYLGTDSLVGLPPHAVRAHWDGID